MKHETENTDEKASREAKNDIQEKAEIEPVPQIETEAQVVLESEPPEEIKEDENPFFQDMEENVVEEEICEEDNNEEIIENLEDEIKLENVQHPPHEGSNEPEDMDIDSDVKIEERIDLGVYSSPRRSTSPSLDPQIARSSSARGHDERSKSREKDPRKETRKQR